jgi:hypothetical protein
MRKAEKIARKEIFGKKGAKDTFQNFLIKDLTYDDGIKMREFWHYCHTIIKCPNCSQQKFDVCKGEGENNYSLLFICTVCLSRTQLYDTETQKMVKWFDDLMMDKAGYSFEEGWPPLVEMPGSIPLNPPKKQKLNLTYNKVDTNE